MGEVGTRKVYEDDAVRVWEMYLPPGESSGVHTHTTDFMFLVVDPSTIEIHDGQGELLVHNDMTAGEVLAFRIQGEELIDDLGDHPPISRTHQATNVGDRTYREVLVEKKR